MLEVLAVFINMYKLQLSLSKVVSIWLYPTAYSIVHETVTGYVPLEDITVDGIAIAKKIQKQLLASIIYTLHLHVKDSLKIIVEDDDEETAVMSINQNSSK